MDITIVGRHTKVAEEFRDRILDKLSKVDELHPRATTLDVHVVHERNPKLANERERVELTLHARGSVIRAEAAAPDRVDALDAAAARLTEQLRRHHERRAHRHQEKPPLHSLPVEKVELPVPTNEQDKVESVEEWEGAPAGSVREIPIDGTPITIRSKTHVAAPMTIAEAVDAMELVGHDFYLFLDADSGMPSAVYRRRGWTYGVIHLSESEEGSASELRESA